MSPTADNMLAPEPTSEIVLRKVAWRLLPFMVFLYVLAYLDRINVGLAALQMTADLRFTETIYGFGAGIFFIGYFLFEVPSNLILQRVGARRWIARIMITWGIIASSMMFVRGTASFYSLRFALGLAEAGFFPGMLLYLTYWFPASYRARTVALFFTATAIAGVIGGPASSACLKMNGLAGLRGWQWLFLLEGLPSVIFGFIVLAFLTDKPDHATWLRNDERETLQAALLRSAARQTSHHATLRAGLTDPRLWLLSAIYFTHTFGLYSFNYWMPKLLKSVSGYSDQRVVLISAIPYALGAIAMIFFGRHSDRTGERRRHAALAALLAACGFGSAAICHNPIALLAALCIAAIGMWCAIPPFWSIPHTFLRDTAAAGGIAAINSIGNLGGFFGPFLFGWIKQHSGASFLPALLMTAGSMLTGALLVLVLPKGSPIATPVAVRPA